MFRRFRWPRERTEQIDAEADALVHYFDVGAYDEARSKEREASSDAAARHWDRVALAVARKTEKRVGLDTLIRMAVDRGFVDG